MKNKPNAPVRCGVYAIQDLESRRFYIGSSVRIHQRWSEHRRHLRNGTHASALLQQAWDANGPDAFRFIVLEDCGRLELQAREQEYLDAYQPAFNAMPIASLRSEALYELLAERGRQRSKIVTHCPNGHEYTEANTYRDRHGKRICRACNALRVSGIYAKETPEQREARRQRVNESHQQHRAERLAKQSEYVAAHKEEKRAYDVARRAVANEQRRARHAVETPEKRATRLAMRRERERDTWQEGNRRRREKLKAATP